MNENEMESATAKDNEELCRLDDGLVDRAMYNFGAEAVDALADLGLIERVGNGVVPTARGLQWGAWDAESTAREMRALADRRKQTSPTSP